MTNINIKEKYEQQYNERYEKLNQKQKEAVDNIDGPMLVIAGPGSGKTELLALRAANILRESQVPPSSILLLTFTDSGATNMRKRLTQLIGERGYKVAVYTFHSFASDIMSKYSEYFYNGASFRPATDVERIGILESIIEAMPRANKLASKHPDMGYTYLSDIISCISALKKGNYTSGEWRELIITLNEEYAKINSAVSEILIEIKGKRKVDMILDAYAEIVNELRAIDSDVSRYILATLELEIAESIKANNVSNLTKFKNEYFTYDEAKEMYMLKDSRDEKISKWLELAEVYDKYNNEMYSKGLYDYDDMIFKVAQELKINSSLRSELEEKYQYIMVDEFQDSSDSQMALIFELTSSPVNEGRPNVMAVGDDDQAIYKFQGAELDNIYKFRSHYNDVKLVTLIENYRSTQDILDKSRSVITKAIDRLEVRYSGEIDKNIKASNKNLIESNEGNIVEKGFMSSYQEFEFVATEIKEILSKGVSPSEISVISRSHNNLKKLSEIMNEYKLPYSYEKKENALDKKPIQELINIVNYVGGVNGATRDDLLPVILSYEFWGLERIDVWRIAEKVREGEVSVGELGEKNFKRISWLTAMLSSDNAKVKSVANFLIELAGDAKSLPLTHLLDKIIGTREWEIDDELSGPSHGEGGEAGRGLSHVSEFISPFRSYYFGKDNFDHNKPEYLDFLFALRTFIGALREYGEGSIMYASEMSDFVNIYNNNSNLSLSIISPFATSDNAVTLQTAHKSKGLEYEYVFIINSDEDEWNKRGMPRRIGMPAHLGLLPMSDDLDDKIRLYYVAMTRAKHTLYITHNNEKFSPLLDINDSQVVEESAYVPSDELVNSLSIRANTPLIDDEKVLLRRLLENYKMPVTHLINYLNISKVGPGKFIEQNLLRFPQAMSPSSVYGSAMHSAMQNYYLYYKKHNKLADNAKLIEFFTNAMNSGSLSEADYNKYLESGIENLNIYIEDLKGRGLDSKDMVEVNFENEGVYISDCHATGKIDKMSFEGDRVVVTDLKTGKSFDSWEGGSSAYDKIKLHFFKYQLAYYYLLIKNSRTYNNYKVEIGNIEFLEADSNGDISILSLTLDEELISRVERLTNVIYNKVINLDFPDTSKYKMKDDGLEEKSELTIKDILAFEEDLLEGRI